MRLVLAVVATVGLFATARAAPPLTPNMGGWDYTGTVTRDVFARGVTILHEEIETGVGSLAFRRNGGFIFRILSGEVRGRWTRSGFIRALNFRPLIRYLIATGAAFNTRQTRGSGVWFWRDDGTLAVYLNAQLRARVGLDVVYQDWQWHVEATR